MKKIINGKKYDTETAEAVGSWSNGRYNDFALCSETLYRKRTGEFFIYGIGGPMSRYSKTDGNLTRGGEDIRPLTAAAAMSWAEEKLTADKYESIFEVEE